MSVPFLRRNLYVALAVFALFAGYIAWAYSFPESNRMMPLIVGWAGLVLCALDIVAHTETRAGRLIAILLSGSAHAEAEETRRKTSAEVVAVLWMVAVTAGVVLAGLLPATLVYVFAYMWLHGRRTVLQSAIGAIATALFVWLVFEQALSYPLYRGIFFES